MTATTATKEDPFFFDTIAMTTTMGYNYFRDVAATPRTQGATYLLEITDKATTRRNASIREINFTNAPFKGLDAVPYDVLLEIIRDLSFISQVCLALTNHHLYDLVLATNGAKSLVDIMWYLEDLPWWLRTYWRGAPDIFSDLMELLVDWVPREYKLCALGSCGFVISEGGDKEEEVPRCPLCKEHSELLLAIKWGKVPRQQSVVAMGGKAEKGRGIFAYPAKKALRG